MQLTSPEPAIDESFTAASTFWPRLTRSGDRLAFPLPGRFVVPGGFFRWFFYWDSCFVVPGLLVSGERELAREVVDSPVLSIEEYGFVPNYNSPKGVCASRSQPPFVAWAIREVWPTVGEVPLVLGGEPLPARPGVLCSSCNARKGLSQRRRRGHRGRPIAGVALQARSEWRRRHGQTRGASGP